MLEFLQYLSIALEVMIAGLGLMIFFQKKKYIGIYIFITFSIYVFYDFAKQIGTFNTELLYVLFFIATVSIFYGVWKFFREKNESLKIKSRRRK